MTQSELEGLWVKGSLSGVAFSFDDAVRIKAGGRAGEVGRIVALLAIEPTPDYIVELPDGSSERAVEADLERAV